MPQPTLRPPSLVSSTLWACKAIRPAQQSQILQASGFTCEPFLELSQGARIILHAKILHVVATGVNPIPRFYYFFLRRSFVRFGQLMREKEQTTTVSE
jgi:hypothetical protein